MRKSQISAAREADWGPIQSSIRWNAAFAGLCVALLVFAALAALTMGLFAGSMNSASLNPMLSPELPSASKWILTLLFISGAIALFTGAFVSARASNLITVRVGRTQGLVISSVFFALVFAAGYFGGSASPHFRSIRSSSGLEGISVAQTPDMAGLIESRLKGVTYFNWPVEKVHEGIMKRMAANNPEDAYAFLAERTGLLVPEAKRRLEPIRAEIGPAYAAASSRSSYLARLVGFLVSGAILLGSLAAMAGGTVGALWNLRAPLNKYDQEALGESVAA